jgi:uncharacterized protein YyaL (SSP411 family)
MILMIKHRLLVMLPVVGGLFWLSGCATSPESPSAMEKMMPSAVVNMVAPAGVTGIKVIESPALTTADAAAGEWIPDFDQAVARARETGYPLLVAFVGSDWCQWSQRMAREIFDDAEFKAFAGQQVVAYKADFPIQRELPPAVKVRNSILIKQYKVSGFPAVLLLKPDGTLIARTGYARGGAHAYVAHLNRLLGRR